MSSGKLFNEFFHSDRVSARDKQLYCGQDELWGLQDEQRRQLDAVRSATNEAWTSQGSKLRRQGSAPVLHFDYIDTRRCGAGELTGRRVSNAIAFDYQNCSFVGVTRDLMDDCASNAARLASTQRISGGFGLRPSQLDAVSNLAQAFFQTQAYFISSHELGHHFHGHILRDHANSLYVEYRGDAELTREAALISQRKEIDADGYATWMCLNNFLVTEGPRAAFLGGIGRPMNHKRGERWLLRLVVLSAAAFFFSRAGTREPLNRSSHPPALVRVHFVMNQIHNWAKHNGRPRVTKWASVARFQKLMAAVEQAIGSDHQTVDWYEQSAFFLSDAGAQYRKVLQEAEAPVRKYYEQSIWHIVR